MLEPLSQDVRTRLLRYARETLVAVALGRRAGPPPTGGRMDELSSVFVTLRKRGELRGCIGNTRFDRPLGPLLADLTKDSATQDPRFPPVTPDEVADLTIEISRLSPATEVSEDEVELGRHGVIIRSGGQIGLLLPQVANEFDCTISGFLELACRKAALPPGAWRDPDVTLSVFEAEVFGE